VGRLDWIVFLWPARHQAASPHFLYLFLSPRELPDLGKAVPVFLPLLPFCDARVACLHWLLRARILLIDGFPCIFFRYVTQLSSDLPLGTAGPPLSGGFNRLGFELSPSSVSSRD